eukprot:1159526-Pelagomonas_calceolata.AAC.5
MAAAPAPCPPVPLLPTHCCPPVLLHAPHSTALLPLVHPHHHPLLCEQQLQQGHPPASLAAPPLQPAAQDYVQQMPPDLALAGWRLHWLHCPRAELLPVLLVGQRLVLQGDSACCSEIVMEVPLWGGGREIWAGGYGEGCGTCGIDRYSIKVKTVQGNHHISYNLSMVIEKESGVHLHCIANRGSTVHPPDSPLLDRSGRKLHFPMVSRETVQNCQPPPFPTHL